MVYLNAEFEGGNTTFFTVPEVAIKPETRPARLATGKRLEACLAGGRWCCIDWHAHERSDPNVPQLFLRPVDPHSGVKVARATSASWRRWVAQ